MVLRCTSWPPPGRRERLRGDTAPRELHYLETSTTRGGGSITGVSVRANEVWAGLPASSSRRTSCGREAEARELWFGSEVTEAGRGKRRFVSTAKKLGSASSSEDLGLHLES